MKYLLDTNVLSETIKSSPNPSLMAMVEKNRDRLATAAPVWHELWFGSFRLPPSRKRDNIQDYLFSLAHSSLKILPYDMRAALHHAKERARLVKMGRTPAFVDGQIAAIASVNRLVLVSRNTKDLEHFSGESRWKIGLRSEALRLTNRDNQKKEPPIQIPLPPPFFCTLPLAK